MKNMSSGVLVNDVVTNQRRLLPDMLVGAWDSDQVQLFRRVCPAVAPLIELPTNWYSTWPAGTTMPAHWVPLCGHSGSVMLTPA